VKYFFIGERELVLAFRLVGVRGIAAVTREECLEAFKHVTLQGGPIVAEVQEHPKVLIITELVSQSLAEEVTAWQMKGEYPLIVEIPGIMGHLEGKQTLTDAIREAIGIHV